MQVDITSKAFKKFMRAKGWRFGKVPLPSGVGSRSLWYLPLGKSKRASYEGPEWNADLAEYAHIMAIQPGVVVQMNTPSRPHIHTHLGVVQALEGSFAVVETGFRGRVTKSKVQIEDLMFVGALPMEQIFPTELVERDRP